MAVNLYDHANQLEQALRESDEYQAIQNAYENVKANEESKKLFEEFRETQLSFQQKQNYFPTTNAHRKQIPKHEKCLFPWKDNCSHMVVGTTFVTFGSF